MFKFLLAAVLTWFSGTQIGLLFEYNELCSNSQPEKIVVEIKPVLAQFANQIETENSVALNLQMSDLAEKLKIRQRRIAYYFFSNIEQPHFPNLTFAEIFVLNQNGEIIRSLEAKYQDSSFREISLTDEDKSLINKSLQAEQASKRIDEERKNLLSFPLQSADGKVLGVLFVREQAPFSWWHASTKAARDFLYDISQFWITLAIFGFLFGFLQAHIITRRLEQIEVAVKAWSKGDFYARASENKDDEMGGLSKMLNQMAKSLQEVFEIKRELAMSEERNRIARDLHDSVKQQIFGLGMQIGAAKATLKNNPEAVENRLTEAENLVRQVQAELVDLIRELRPQTDEYLCGKVENYLQNWSRQNVITADCFLETELKLPQPVENTLFRIIQEALANIAKHSRAEKAKIELKKEQSVYQLTISDNGIGFDGKKQTTGIGLKTMRERAESLKNGKLKIESKNGVKITVEFEI